MNVPVVADRSACVVLREPALHRLHQAVGSLIQLADESSRIQHFDVGLDGILSASRDKPSEFQ